MSLSVQQRIALRDVVDGRITYGNPEPRNLTPDGSPVRMGQFMKDGVLPYAGYAQTLRSLNERELIRVATDRPAVPGNPDAWQVMVTPAAVKAIGEEPAAARAGRAEDAGEGS